MNDSEILRINIPELNDVKFTVDWRYLRDGKGVRKIENVFQVVLGRILFWLVFVTEVGIIVYEVTKGYYFQRIVNVEGATGLAFWIFVCIFLYSLYFLRDRGVFLDKARVKNLHKLRKDLERGRTNLTIEVTDYLNHHTVWLLDYIFNIPKNDYLQELFVKLLKLNRARILIERLGLSFENFDLGLLSQATVGKGKVEVLRDLIADSFSFAFENNFKYAGEESFTFVILQKFFLEYLQRFNIISKDFDGIKLWLQNEALKQRYVEVWKDKVSIKPKTTVNRAYTSRFTPMLNSYCRDFTNAVIQGEFVVSLARENELNQLIALLEKGEKSGVLVLGEPGVGKTTLIKSLAVRMVVEDIPPKLQDMRLIGFDFNKAFSTSKNVDSFKKKLQKVFEEVAQSKNVILVLDNFDQLLNLRREITGEIVNIIVNAYDAHNFRMIVTSDKGQFTRFIRPHKALASIFSEVEMNIPTDEVATQIVIDEVPTIENEYNIKIAYSGVKASIELSHKFAYDRVLPDKAINLLKETVVNFKNLKGKKPIEYDEVAKIVSSKVGVELGSIKESETEKLAKLEGEMHKRVIDQNEAIDAVCGALRRARSGLGQAGKPIASFLFFGPTGVGKTEVAKTVAEVYYGSEKRMVRLDMSEYHEEENLKRLIGYTSEQGSFEGGFLTEPVYDNPFSLVLLDEIDKANPKVLDLFLQVLDEGYLDDGLGRRIDFSNTIIIATSNAGSKLIADLIEQDKVYEEVRTQALEELKRVFRIEFLNRFDKIIMFKPLSREDVKLIAKKFVEQVRLKLLDKGIKLNYSDALLERLAHLGYNPVFGAREMRRVVQEQVENKVAEMIVRGEVRSGDNVNL
ncbi:ATP-dependent Clp protease ATP-binding subunit [Candidatus Dojkabacteria bacterium]|nr:ATP-dependent Clp protease ATP-binding subunit [Candidatus Dojkabacteria bacterium]